MHGRHRREEEVASSVGRSPWHAQRNVRSWALMNGWNRLLRTSQPSAPSPSLLRAVCTLDRTNPRSPPRQPNTLFAQPTEHAPPSRPIVPATRPPAQRLRFLAIPCDSLRFLAIPCDLRSRSPHPPQPQQPRALGWMQRIHASTANSLGTPSYSLMHPAAVELPPTQEPGYLSALAHDSAPSVVQLRAKGVVRSRPRLRQLATFTRGTAYILI
ncbi:hypothetical protein AB1N83_004501 [Pleurotus pulmonarius]